MIYGKVYSTGDKKIPDKIPTSLYGISASSAMMMRDELEPGTIVGVRNPNDLSEINIYRRNDMTANVNPEEKWDGISVDTSWYDANSTQDVYALKNAAQFAGLACLVNSGVTFDGKLIRFQTDIHLDYKEWTPIGTHMTKDMEDDSECSIESRHPFCGSLDGCGYTIYGLRISNPEKNGKFCGLFGAISGATIKNMVLDQVRVGSIIEDTSYAAICGYSKSSMFSNIIVSGVIRGEGCSAISCISVDTSFYNCINRATLICRVDCPEDNRKRTLLVGGMVQQIYLTEKVARLANSYEQAPDVFINCIQGGTITVQTGNVERFYGGQLYGVIVSDSERCSITINRCMIKAPMIVDGFRKGESKSIFSGVTPEKKPVSHVGEMIGNKIDLLDGMIGKTPTAMRVRVIRITSSTVIDKMVIRGSVNVLESDHNTNTFQTTDINEIGVNDGIEVLEPYFTYVQTKNI